MFIFRLQLWCYLEVAAIPAPGVKLDAPVDRLIEYPDRLKRVEHACQAHEKARSR